MNLFYHAILHIIIIWHATIKEYSIRNYSILLHRIDISFKTLNMETCKHGNTTIINWLSS
jgi:hypothetical protein